MIKNVYSTNFTCIEFTLFLTQTIFLDPPGACIYARTHLLHQVN